MKLFFRKAAQTAAQNLADLLMAGKYKKAAQALHDCSLRRQHVILEEFFCRRQGNLIVENKKVRPYHAPSFVEYLADKNDLTLIRALVKSGSDHFSMSNSDILISLYQKRPAVLETIFKTAPWIEHDFENALSFENWQVQAEIYGRQSLKRDVSENSIICATDTWLPRRNIRAYLPKPL